MFCSVKLSHNLKAENQVGAVLVFVRGKGVTPIDGIEYAVQTAVL
jgi:hypothetical protein